jgi:hypothetical protein
VAALDPQHKISSSKGYERYIKPLLLQHLPSTSEEGHGTSPPTRAGGGGGGVGGGGGQGTRTRDGGVARGGGLPIAEKRVWKPEFGGLVAVGGVSGSEWLIPAHSSPLLGVLKWFFVTHVVVFKSYFY